MTASIKTTSSSLWQRAVPHRSRSGPPAAARRQAVSIAVAKNRGAPLFERRSPYPDRDRHRFSAGFNAMQAGTESKKIVLNRFLRRSGQSARVYRG